MHIALSALAPSIWAVLCVRWLPMQRTGGNNIFWWPNSLPAGWGVARLFRRNGRMILCRSSCLVGGFLGVGGDRRILFCNLSKLIQRETSRIDEIVEKLVALLHTDAVYLRTVALQ